MYLLTTTADIPVCQLPTVLEVIYFGKLLINVVRLLLPIGLIIFCMFDFSKCVVAGDTEEQAKKSKLVFKRIIYAVLVFSVPYIVSLMSTVLNGLVPDYDSCINNATLENIQIYKKEYDKAVEIENQQIKEAYEETLNNTINSSVNSLNSESNQNVEFINLKQADPRWGKVPLCTNYQRGGNDKRTIASSGCGFVSYTMVLRSFGNDIYPNQLVEKVCSLGGGKFGHAVPDDFFLLNKTYGLKGKSLGVTDYDVMYAALRDGKRLIINFPGHYISILGIKNGNIVKIGDSSRRYGDGSYTLQNIANNEGTFYNVTAIWKE